MTGQISDSFLYQEQSWSIASSTGEPLFKPETYGLSAFGRTTNCWLGYVCTYRLQADRLVLDRLEINLSLPGEALQRGQGPVLNGVAPIDPGELEPFDNLYENMQMEIPFSGTMQIARDLIYELYVHMGFQAPWKYKTVFELAFEAGKLVSAKDVSEQMAEVRKFASQPFNSGSLFNRGGKP